MTSARPSRAVSQLRKGCWQVRKMFIPMIMTAQLQAKMVVTRRLTWAPITSRRQRGEQHQRHQGERDAEGQHDLAEHQRLGGVHPASCSQRSFASSTRARTSLSPGVSIRLCEHAGHGRHETRQTPLQCRNHASPVRVSRPRRHHASSKFHPQDFRLLTRPEQQHPSGCLFLHARPGRQRNELNNFRFAFPQVRTRSERQQEAQEALGDPRPFLLPSFA